MRVGLPADIPKFIEDEVSVEDVLLHSESVMLYTEATWKCICSKIELMPLLCNDHKKEGGKSHIGVGGKMAIDFCQYILR
jgi:hypothetical protein